MPLIILFGLPGTGKSYVGKIFEKYFDYYFYDGDEDLTPKMKAAIKTKTVFTDQMRNIYFKILISKIKILSKKHQNLVVSQTFIKEKYRVNLLEKIPEAKFVLVETDKFTREKRLNERTNYPLDLEYARKMELNFEKPGVKHSTIVNNMSGNENVKKQIINILSSPT